MKNPVIVMRTILVGAMAFMVAAGALAAQSAGYAGQARTFMWNPGFNDVVDTAQYRKQAPFVIGFSNAGVADGWLVTFKHGVEWAAAQHRDRIGKFLITDANWDAERLAETASDRVGAAVAAEQRHHGTAVLRHGDDRRLPTLVGEHGREGSDQNAGGAYPHDVGPLREQPSQLGADIVERDVRAGHPGRVAVNPGARPAIPDVSGHLQAGVGQHDDGDGLRHSPTPQGGQAHRSNRVCGSPPDAPSRPPVGTSVAHKARGKDSDPNAVRWAPRSPRRHPSQALPRAWSRIMEKYGAVSPSTSASGRIFSLAMVACST